MKRLKEKITECSVTPSNWKVVHDLWETLAKEYIKFNNRYKKELLENYNIDCGTDYANYIFNSLNIKH